jgi:Flp pilus assembly protein TadB
MMKLAVALGAMAVVALIANRTLTDQRIRLATFIVLGFFALRIVFAHRQQQREKLEEQGK